MNRSFAATLALLTLTTPALAHTGAGAHFGFGDGFVHPLLGLDHLLAMVGVGLWAAMVGGTARWLWPLAFVTVMTAAGALALAGIAIPHVEVLILASVVGIGAAVAFELRLPVIAGAGICAVLAVAHGVAHGTELPTGASVAGYVAGFVVATAGLHAVGVGVGLWLQRSNMLARLAGAAMVAAGAALAFT